MSLAIINNYSNVLDARRRQIIKRKVLAIGKMTRNYVVLKEHPQLVQQLKNLNNGKLPIGTLATGEQGIREAIIQKTLKLDFKLKEQKGLYHHHHPTSNYKIVSREGHV